MMNKEYFTHSKEGTPPSEWQRLKEHLENVGEMGRGFAEQFFLTHEQIMNLSQIVISSHIEHAQYFIGKRGNDE